MAEDNSQTLWPGWETVRVIGRGSFGTVYEIERDVFGRKEKAALKVITIPQNSSDIEELRSNGYDDASITNTFKSHLKNILDEYSLMRKLNGTANVVNCDDVRYVQHDDGYGWDIYIKMELVTPLAKALGELVSEQQVIQIGKDICQALILCKKHNIVHRDIKPANIFVSENGDYKLGDFGIAKTVEKTSGGTKIGTYEYMAPEVYHDEPYGHSADIYSLGLVLYWLLNERRTPFMPLPPKTPEISDKDNARKKRFGGEAIPAPAHGSKELKQIVLKACAYNPNDRFLSAKDFLAALSTIGTGDTVLNAEDSASKTIYHEPEDDSTGTAGFFHTGKDRESDKDRTKSEMTVNAFGDDGTETAGFSRTKSTPQQHSNDPHKDKPRRPLFNSRSLAAVIAIIAIVVFSLVIRNIAVNKNSEDLVVLAEKYYRGEGVKQNYSKAFSYFTKAAKAGNADAMNGLGRMYYEGIGVAQDYSKAGEWFVKAADLGNTSAMSSLGTLYYQGLGTAQDYGQALKWFLEAEHGGNSEVQYILGYMYEMGYGTETDLAQAASWYQKAAQNGDKDAAARLSALQETEKTRGLLTGQWGDTEAIHNGTTAAFYLDSPVSDCGRLTMTLRIASYTGYPFGEWYLYLLDAKENWTHVAKFNIDKQQADGKTVTYDLVFDSPESFRALAICPAENGMEFTMGRELLFYNR